MIKVKVTKSNEYIKDVLIKGHANSGDYGKDLVCAGVSAIATGVCNTLASYDFLNSNTIQLKEGFIHIQNNSLDDKYQMILETLVISLQTMEDGYGKYIKINIQEE